MNDEVNRQTFGGKRHANGVDEEGHVVIDDLDDRVMHGPAMLLAARIERAQLGLARLALLRELPERERRAVEILGAAADEIGARDVIVELREEALDHDRAARAEPLGGEARDRFQRRLFLLLRP